MEIDLKYPEDLGNLKRRILAGVLQSLLYLRENPEAGKQLEPAATHQQLFADLSAYRTFTVPSLDYYEEYRIVYRVVNDRGVDVIEVLAIGPRMASKVYRMASDRLSPPRRRVRASLGRRLPNFRQEGEGKPRH